LADTLNKSFSHIKNQTSNLKQFISDVSHEFKTPLMVINSQIDLYNKKLEKDKLNCDDTKILLEKISQNTKKLNKILELFLQLSRIENKIENFEKNEVVLDEYLKKISKDYLSTSKKDIKIIYQTKKDILLNINKDTFNVLFENLL
jgi:signal transduction histidine kinase